MRRYIAITLILAACNKSTSTIPIPASTISATINGTPTTFNAIITVDTLSIPHTVYIVAHSDSANLTPLLELTLSTTPLKTGTYPFTGTVDSTGTPTSPTGVLGYTNWLNGTAVQYPAITDTITLATATKTSFSGTFQGTCAYSADSVVFITNGQFTASYPQH